jgi:hypothetical protein
VLFILFFVLWSIARWPERQRLLWSFLGTLALMLAASEAVLPHWIPEFLNSARANQDYSGGEPSVLRALLPAVLAYLISALLLLIFLVLCWKWRAADANSEKFAWALAWAGAITLVVLPKLSSYNHPLLIPSLLVLLAHRKRIWQGDLLARALTKGAFACQLWQWGTAALLALFSFVVPPARLQFTAGLPQYTLFALPPLTLLALMAASFTGTNRPWPIVSVTPRTAAAPHE